MVKPTSKSAFKKADENRPTQRAQVLAVIRRRPAQGFTRKELAAEMGLPINIITPRVRELLDAGAVIETGYRRAPGDKCTSAVVKVVA